MVAFAGHPLMVGNRLAGVMALFARTPLSRFVQRSLESVADGIALGIERRRAMEEREKLEAQFLQSQKMEAVGRLAGGIAHDFNNLLTAILGYSNLFLSRMAEDDPQRRDLLEIVQAGDRAAVLTRQLLAFSRKQVLVPEVLDLGAVVVNLNQMLRRLIGEDIELVTEVDSEASRVKADRGQVEQVIVNLVVNARDAMPRGGRLIVEVRDADPAELQTRGRGVPASSRYVMLAISDTGVGMDAEVQSHVFEPFFTTKEQGKGTGLGLATVYGIVRQSGGFIDVDSTPGAGTKFTIYLPGAETPVAAAEQAKGPRALPHGDLPP